MELSQNKKAVIFILIAFIFSFAVRLIWVYQFSGAEQFKFNNEFMINTNDGYAFAEGARDILAGGHQENDKSFLEQTPAKFTAFLAKILNIKFETLILYMPVFFSSLIVIPIILIAREFDKLDMGLIAALVGSIAWSYYNRTMVGYYDTDFLNIVFPTILLWSLIWALDTGEEKYFLIAGIDSILYRSWYPASYSLEFAFISLIGCYMIYQFIKKENIRQNILLITFMIFAIVNLDIFIRLALVLAFYVSLKFQKELILKYVYFIFGFSIILFFVTGGFDPIWVQLKQYILRSSVEAKDTNGLGLQFFTVMQTVREAGKIPFETFANRISGHTITFIFSIIGYILLTIRHKVMLLALPMLGLGFLAYGIPGLVNGGGLRFTVYAVPILALGLGYLIFSTSKLITQNLKGLSQLVSYYLILIILTAGALYPNIKHIINYRVPTVFNKNEVQILDKLKTIADRKDYVVTWWDYGYPIRYYSDVKTLVDGGKHSGAVNFPVSFILNSPQEEAAKMARLDVEYTEKRYKLGKKNEELNETQRVKWASSNIEQMTVDYGFDDTNDFLLSLQNDIKLPQKTSDIFVYLPNRMMNIFPTVGLFSNIDLMNGKKGKRPFFFQSRGFKNKNNIIDVGGGVKILSKKGKVQVGKREFNINNFVVAQYDKKGKLKKRVQTIDKNSFINVIFMKSYNKFLILDTRVYNSLYIQLFVLENFDKNLFEPVVLNPFAKVYKLKI